MVVFVMVGGSSIKLSYTMNTSALSSSSIYYGTELMVCFRLDAVLYTGTVS